MIDFDIMLKALNLFYKKILEFFLNELKTLYSYDQKQELILFNNKDILADGKPIFLSEWFRKVKSKDFYNLFNGKIHTEDQTGPKRWSEKLSF